MTSFDALTVNVDPFATNLTAVATKLGPNGLKTILVTYGGEFYVNDVATSTLELTNASVKTTRFGRCSAGR
jgi:hypothetical protein